MYSGCTKLDMRDLDQWMKQEGLDDKAVAALVGTSRVQISRIRRGLSGTRRDKAEKLQDLTGIPWPEFIGSPAKQNA